MRSERYLIDYSHKDPTDRIIIAQAVAEKMPLISSDRKFHDYKRSGLEFVFNKR